MKGVESSGGGGGGEGEGGSGIRGCSNVLGCFFVIFGILMDGFPFQTQVPKLGT